MEFGSCHVHICMFIMVYTNHQCYAKVQKGFNCVIVCCIALWIVNEELLICIRVIWAAVAAGRGILQPNTRYKATGGYPLCGVWVELIRDNEWNCGDLSVISFVNFSKLIFIFIQLLLLAVDMRWYCFDSITFECLNLKEFIQLIVGVGMALTTGRWWVGELRFDTIVGISFTKQKSKNKNKMSDKNERQNEIIIFNPIQLKKSETDKL